MTIAKLPFNKHRNKLNAKNDESPGKTTIKDLEVADIRRVVKYIYQIKTILFT